MSVKAGTGMVITLGRASEEFIAAMLVSSRCSSVWEWIITVQMKVGKY